MSNNNEGRKPAQVYSKWMLEYIAYTRLGIQMDGDANSLASGTLQHWLHGLYGKGRE